MELSLPIGLVWEGQRYREVEVGPPRGILRRELLNLQGSPADRYKATRIVLKHMLEGVGPLKPEENVISSLFYHDCVYITYEIAKDLQEKDSFSTNAFCPQCRTNVEVDIRWDDVSVVPIEETEFNQDLLLPFSLKYGAKNPRTGKVGKSGFWKLYTLKEWEQVVKQIKNPNDVRLGNTENSIILLALHSIDGFEPGEFTAADLDMLHLKDKNIMAALYGQNEPGVKLPKIHCQTCNSQLTYFVDWTDFLLNLA